MQGSQRKIALIGATGAVGGHVLDEVLRSNAYSTVTTLGRRPATPARTAELPQGRLVQHVVDFAKPDSYRPLLAMHTDAVCTLGVGQPSKMPFEEV